MKKTRTNQQNGLLSPINQYPDLEDGSFTTNKQGNDFNSSKRLSANQSNPMDRPSQSLRNSSNSNSRRLSNPLSQELNKSNRAGNQRNQKIQVENNPQNQRKNEKDISSEHKQLKQPVKIYVPAQMQESDLRSIRRSYKKSLAKVVDGMREENYTEEQIKKFVNKYQLFYEECVARLKANLTTKPPNDLQQKVPVRVETNNHFHYQQKISTDLQQKASLRLEKQMLKKKETPIKLNFQEDKQALIETKEGQRVGEKVFLENNLNKNLKEQVNQVKGYQKFVLNVNSRYQNYLPVYQNNLNSVRSQLAQKQQLLEQIQQVHIIKNDQEVEQDNKISEQQEI